MGGVRHGDLFESIVRRRVRVRAVIFLHLGMGSVGLLGDGLIPIVRRGEGLVVLPVVGLRQQAVPESAWVLCCIFSKERALGTAGIVPG